VVPYIQVAPLALIRLVFFGIPLVTVIVVSFFDYVNFQTVPAFLLYNYEEVFSSNLTVTLYLTMLKFSVIVWLITLFIGFWVSYFLVFHVQSLLWKIFFFLVCTVPFWTSNIIRMISWIPVLGRNGLVNQTLMNLGLIDEPYDFLLFSDFSVIVAYVHLFTLFMVVTLFNAMARIDPAILEAAVDAGASRWQVITQVVIPLSKTGIALGSIFVVTLVMGDFFVVKIMSGGQSSSAVYAMWNEISMLQYPSAAASAVILLMVVVLMVVAILRIVDVRKELSG
jgi:putative spermidine/putrescine transport system permease protein